MENTLGRLETAIGEAERMLTPMPFVYVSHLRSFLVLPAPAPWQRRATVGWRRKIARPVRCESACIL